ncbi:MAG: hypothetical protein ACPGXL_02410 [Chitinophagales bacterium]
MDIKRINPTGNPLSKKIIHNGNNSFKLWLEFEETSPWNDLENNFANIVVDTLDGRGYGLCVWTFSFLHTAHEEECKKGNNNYVTSPDLFVRTLTRDCLEETIKDLLNKGELKASIPQASFSLCFRTPYIEGTEIAYEREIAILEKLKLELSEGHPLHLQSLIFLGLRPDTNEIILELDNDSVAVVQHLEQLKKTSKNYPLTRIYKDDATFWQQEMRTVIQEFKHKKI